jgi:dTDP-L-rhamnose 4-epimerase
MNVLITGGAGFIGTHFTRQLLDLDHAVTVPDNFSPDIHAGKTELAKELKSNVKLIIEGARPAPRLNFP